MLVIDEKFSNILSRIFIEFLQFFSNFFVFCSLRIFEKSIEIFQKLKFLFTSFFQFYMSMVMKENMKKYFLICNDEVKDM